MGFIDDKGDLTPYAWPKGWPDYFFIPLPTRKGMFWSGLDHRNISSGPSRKGAFLQGASKKIHKVIQGATTALTLSPDGCFVAFYNNLDDGDQRKSSLKVFDACNSTENDKVLDYVDY